MSGSFLNRLPAIICNLHPELALRQTPHSFSLIILIPY